MRGRRRYPLPITKDTKGPGGRPTLPRTIILRIRSDVVFLPVLPRLLFPVLLLHAGRDREGAEGRDAQDHESGRGEDGDTADEPALQRGVGVEGQDDGREGD